MTGHHRYSPNADEMTQSPDIVCAGTVGLLATTPCHADHLAIIPLSQKTKCGVWEICTPQTTRPKHILSEARLTSTHPWSINPITLLHRHRSRFKRSSQERSLSTNTRWTSSLRSKRHPNRNIRIQNFDIIPRTRHDLYVELYYRRRRLPQHWRRFSPQQQYNSGSPRSKA